MKVVNQAAEIATTVLNRCCDRIEEVGPWRWDCSVQNGSLLRASASLTESFLRLESQPEVATTRTTAVIEHAVRVNGRLPGGVKIALSRTGSELKFFTDLVVLDEARLARGLSGSFDGIHEGACLLNSAGTQDADSAAREPKQAAGIAQDLLDNIAWKIIPHDPGEFSLTLDAEGAPPARLRMLSGHVSANVELVRANAGAETARRALAIFLLRATGALRFVRATSTESEAGTIFAFEVSLRSAPAPEELEHALASLSAAYSMCAREANALLDKTVAGFYLAAYDPSTL